MDDPATAAGAPAGNGSKAFSTWGDVVGHYKDLAAKAMEPIRKPARDGIEKLEAVVADSSTTETDREAARQAIEKIRGFDRALDAAEELIATRPQRILDGIAETFSTIEIEPDAKAIDESRRKLEELSPQDRREFEHLATVVRSDDATSVIIGGHVFIDIALEDCFAAYLPYPVNLHDDVEIFTSGKVNLAYALGMLTEAEKAMLLRFNSIRNKIAHRTERPGRPRFIYDREQEQALWSEFVANPAFGGKWRAYNPEEFPEFTRLVVLALYYRLSVRITELKAKTIVPVAEPPSPLLGAIFPGIVSNLPRIFTKIVDAPK